MAHVKLIVASLVVLSAIALKVEAVSNLWRISHTLAREMDETELLPREDRQDAEKAYSFAKKYLSTFEESYDKRAGEEILMAWDQVLHKPDQCDESSVEYIITLRFCELEHRSLETLMKATRKYVQKCMTLEYFANRIESCYNKNITEFVDDQFFADYRSEDLKDRQFGRRVEWSKETRAIAKAIIRERGDNIKDLTNVDQVHAYLEDRLYDPCSDYFRAFNRLDAQMFEVSKFFEGGYYKLKLLLGKPVQDAIFRYQLCVDNVIPKPFETSQQVVSYIKSLPANEIMMQN